MERSGRLKDKVAIITGAGSGIGQAIAIRFAQEGCIPILVDIDVDGLNSTISKIEEFGSKPLDFQVDVTNRASIEQMLNDALQTVGTCDILVNSAGIFFSSPFEEVSDSQWEQMMKVNLTSCFITCQVIIKEWLKREHGGVIINIGSISGERSNYGASHYCAAKAGVASLSRSLAVEYSDRDIRVVTLSPGYTETPMTLPQSQEMEIHENWIRHIPMRRLAKPQEIAETALFLASDEASYITGHTYVVDGGYLLI